MFHGFSRRMLNVLIIGCLLIITWVQLGLKNDEDTPLEPLSVAPLSDTGWQFWQSNEEVPVVWQTLGADKLRIVVKRANAQPLQLSLPVNDWAKALNNELPTAKSSTTGAVVLQGAVDSITMQQAAAFVIRRLQLTPPAKSAESHSCQLEHLAGAYWWNHKAGQSLAMPAQIALDKYPLPTRDEWQDFRQSAVHELRQKWLSASDAIDIQAELAYHRWPETYFYDLYQDIAEAQRTAPEAYATCLTR